MPDFTLEQIEAKYQQLPEDVKEVMISVETAKMVGEIGVAYKLHIDQVGELADEIGLVMLGLINTGEFVGRVRARLQVDQATAETIAREVNEKIFLPIRESLQRLHEQKDRAAEAAASGGVETIQTIAPDQTTDELPAKDKLLDEIENPQATKDTVFEKKLGQLFRIPREEVDLDPYLEKPIK